MPPPAPNPFPNRIGSPAEHETLVAISLSFYGKTRCLSREDVELLRDQLPGGDALRVNLESALATLPPPSSTPYVAVGPVVYPTDYEPLLEAIQSITKMGVTISSDLVELQAGLLRAQEQAADPGASLLEDADGDEGRRLLPLGGDGYQIEPPAIRE